VLLQVVANTRDISGNFHTVGQTHTGDLTQSGVRLLGAGGTNSSANTTLLGGRQIGSLVLQGVQTLLQSRSGRLVGSLLTAISNELIKSRHLFSPFFDSRHKADIFHGRADRTKSFHRCGSSRTDFNTAGMSKFCH
jgi:hypothetical protein